MCDVFKNQLESFFKNKTHILSYCTAYKSTSAGIQSFYFVLYLLQKENFIVHTINDNTTIGVLGYEASSLSKNNNINPLDIGTINFLKKNLNKTIVIYPDSTVGNPLKADKFIRIVNYFYGELNSNIPDKNKESLIFFGDEIEADFFQKYPNFPKENTFNFSFPIRPITDFKNNLNFSERNIEFYYQHKSKLFGLNVPSNIKKRAVELKSDEKNILEKLSKCKCLHLFEETALIYEALLSGSVVNKHPDGFFEKKPIGFIGDKDIGILKKNDPSNLDIKLEQKKISNAKTKYLEWINIAESNLPNFIEFISYRFSNIDYDETLELILKNIFFQKKTYYNREIRSKIKLILKNNLSKKNYENLRILKNNFLKIYYYFIKK